MAVSATALLSNVMREIFSILAIPFAAKHIGYVECAALPGGGGRYAPPHHGLLVYLRRGIDAAGARAGTRRGRTAHLMPRPGHRAGEILTEGGVL